MTTDLPLIGDYSTPQTPLNGARIGVVTFPGTLDDVDALRAVRLTGAEAVSLWHADDDAAAATERGRGVRGHHQADHEQARGDDGEERPTLGGGGMCHAPKL